MKPYLHARSSAKKFGGTPECYLPIHDWFDHTKSVIADVRHRALLHNAFGCYLAEQVFGHEIVNSDGKKVSVRDIAEQHIMEDFGGWIPTLEQWFSSMDIQPWMGGKSKKLRTEIID